VPVLHQPLELREEHALGGLHVLDERLRQECGRLGQALAKLGVAASSDEGCGGREVVDLRLETGVVLVSDGWRCGHG
jgi:hypothetical protein